VTVDDLVTMLDESWKATRTLDKRAHGDLLAAARAALQRYAADPRWAGADLREVEASLSLRLDPFTLRLRADRVEAAVDGGTRIVDTPCAMCSSTSFVVSGWPTSTLAIVFNMAAMIGGFDYGSAMSEQLLWNLGT
jgi:hypothetical protein